MQLTVILKNLFMDAHSGDILGGYYMKNKEVLLHCGYNEKNMSKHYVKITQLITIM